MSTITTWREVAPPPDSISEKVQTAVDRLDPLKHALEEAADADPEVFRETRQRTLRSHAIETGIIERLYDVDWGLTQALVAEGLGDGGRGGQRPVGEDTLAIINDQYDALAYVAEFAQGGRSLTVQFVRELHQIITKHQPTYEATDTLGRTTWPPLHHGEWKSTTNFLVRPDGSQLDCTPPERVQDQMEELVGLFNDATAIHPLVRAAWMHHSFACIHPFEDGNGREAEPCFCSTFSKTTSRRLWWAEMTGNAICRRWIRRRQVT